MTPKDLSGDDRVKFSVSCTQVGYQYIKTVEAHLRRNHFVVEGVSWARQRVYLNTSTHLQLSASLFVHLVALATASCFGGTQPILNKAHYSC